MSRHYVIQDWSNSATWSGEMIGDRLSKSKGHHFLRNGQANVELYAGDEEDDLKKRAKVSIKDRILPQFKRLQTLRAQMVNLEQEYKTTEMTCAEYSMLRDVIMAKIQRAEVLYHKAISVRPTSYENDEQNFDYSEEINCAINDSRTPSAPVVPDIGVGFFAEVVDGLSEENSLKSFLKFSCKAIRKAIHFKHKAAIYLNELKEV